MFGPVIYPLGCGASSVPGGPPSIIRCCQFSRENLINCGRWLPTAVMAPHTVTGWPRSPDVILNTYLRLRHTTIFLVYEVS